MIGKHRIVMNAAAIADYLDHTSSEILPIQAGSGEVNDDDHTAEVLEHLADEECGSLFDSYNSDDDIDWG